MAYGLWLMAYGLWLMAYGKNTDSPLIGEFFLASLHNEM